MIVFTTESGSTYEVVDWTVMGPSFRRVNPDGDEGLMYPNGEWHQIKYVPSIEVGQLVYFEYVEPEGRIRVTTPVTEIVSQ